MVIDYVIFTIQMTLYTQIYIIENSIGKYLNIWWDEYVIIWIYERKITDVIHIEYECIIQNSINYKSKVANENTANNKLFKQLIPEKILELNLIFQFLWNQ